MVSGVASDVKSITESNLSEVVLPNGVDHSPTIPLIKDLAKNDGELSNVANKMISVNVLDCDSPKKSDKSPMSVLRKNSSHSALRSSN